MAVWRTFLLLGLIAVVGFALPSKASANSKYAAFVMHADSGDVLFDRYADQTRYPASLTKVMTLYLLFEELEAGRLSLDSELKISATAAGQPPSKLGLTAGSTIDVETAIKALVVKSANDVAVVVAEAIGDSEWRFAQKMTEKARQIGMRRTTFRNASGLPNSKQVSTARDLATMSRRVMQDFPQYYHYFATRDFTWNDRKYTSHNAVTRTYEGADGLKTGYTRISGFNLTTSAVRGNDRLIGVVLGGRSVRTRDDHMREILTTAFNRIGKNPALIASLHRNTPAPRLKPTLVAALAAAETAPTIAGDDLIRAEIVAAAGELSSAPADSEADDALGALIAAADQSDLNEFQRARIASLSSFEGSWGEGDVETLTASGFSVQIGAYTSKELAQKELETAARAAGLVERGRTVQPTETASGGTLYRARFVAMTASEADEACAALTRRKVNCFVAPPPATAATASAN